MANAVRPITAGFCRSKGFSLLEAVVSIAIFAAVASALFTWLAVNLNSLSRVEAARQADEATQVALGWVSTINPMETPQGDTEIGHFSIRWTSRALTQPVDGISPGGGSSLYSVQLYEITATVEGNAEPATFTVRRAGWRQTRQSALPF